MRPFGVVKRSPFIEGALAIRKIAKAAPTEHLGFECAMEAFFLALGLRVERPTVQNPDAETHQPDAEAGVGISTGVAPGWSAIHQNCERQAITAECRLQR